MCQASLGMLLLGLQQCSHSLLCQQCVSSAVLDVRCNQLGQTKAASMTTKAAVLLTSATPCARLEAVNHCAGT